MKTLRKQPIKKKFIITGSIIFFFIILILLSSLAAVRFQAAMRTFVGGEGLYSKAQKSATYSLLRYVDTGDERHYEAYEEQLQVPLGVRILFLEILAEEIDYDVAREGYTRQ